MSATNVYIVRTTHLHKDNPMKPPKQAHIHRATLNMQKCDTLIFLQMGAKHLEKTHAMSLNVCDESIQDQGRLRIWV